MKPRNPLQDRRIEAQPSWVIRNRNVELAVTKWGAHMAPVTFCLDQKQTVQPYYISPWQNEKPSDLPPVMVPLRGDFFCLPFGANQKSYRGEQHPPHGETAGSRWMLERVNETNGATTLSLRLSTNIR